MNQLRNIFLFCGILFFQNIYSQEIVVPLKQNASLLKVNHQFKSKKTRLSLPFIDDFSYQGPYPDATLWVENQVYVNNTMSDKPITRGVATFDGLNHNGRPYMPLQSSAGYADSMTSQVINLSSFTGTSNIYMSFYFQPQGLGFAPELNDSLFLFFKNNANQWERVWKVAGSSYKNFELVMLPIQTANYLHANFQFRFVNFASLNINDDVWNIDYVKIDANRSVGDSIMNDIAFGIEPTSLLNPYKSMPYRHFVANQSNEKASALNIKINNNYANTNAVTTQYISKEKISATPISNGNIPSITVGAKSILPQSFPMYNVSYIAPNNKSKVIIEDQYFYNQINVNDYKRNDTIVGETIFDNYFAYDDGSAEKSYFLFPAFNFPSKIALNFKLNEPDTLRGLMVHFGGQAPTALGKYFSIVLYKSLAGAIGTDSIILQDDLKQVQYDTAINGFSTYAFQVPTLLDSGQYFIGITQPANFGSDSIYYGLDVNSNTSSQFLYYNVNGTWQTSSVNGSVMIRPMVGQTFTPTAINHHAQNAINMKAFPNPTHDIITLEADVAFKRYKIFSIDGKMVQSGLMNAQIISLVTLPNGIYLLQCQDKQGKTATQKIIKN